MTLSTRIATTARASSRDEEARWAAVVARDPAFDGQFFYSVETTGVFCKPSCGSRPPRLKNIRFHDTADDARRAGFRACKRCRPDRPSLAQDHAVKIAKACRIIEGLDEEPTLAALASLVAMSPYHFHRVFKAAVGVTPKAYAIAERNKRIRAGLGTSASVTEAIYGAGFNSNGHFYATSSQSLGMTPNEFRTGATDIEIRFAVGACALGSVLVAASDQGVCAIMLGEDPDQLVRELETQFPRAHLIGGDASFERLAGTVIGFVEDPHLGLDLPLDIRGTAFQHRVWDALRRIKPGTTASYAEIAAQIGAPKAVRAVARACASNRLAVAIPCHRVVRSDGAISGYRWGIERKRALLERESKA